MKLALVIGIDDYPGQPLNGCVNDAEAMATKLRFNGDSEGSPNFEVKVATNVRTRAELRGMIRNLFARNADTALLYFSGHGYAGDGGNFLVTPDGINNDIGVLMDEILLYANRSTIRTKIIILDCCNAGSMGTPENLANASQLHPGIVILTSSREKESSKEKNGHGVFTSLLIDALNGAAADLKGDITPGSIYAYIDTAIGNWEQRPMFLANVARFAPIRRVKPFIEMEIIRKITELFQQPNAEYHLDPSYEHIIKSKSIIENVAIFKALLELNRAGLVMPIGAEDMYVAAVRSKSCRLTVLGRHYWDLIKDDRL